MENQHHKSTPRDVFLHLLAIITLYISVASILSLLFDYINVYFPDALNPYYDAGDPIRWALSALIIVFIVFFFVSRFLHRDLKANPEKVEMRIRKWLLNFTLFAAALLIIGDLVALIYNFLQGELTARFLLKILSILIVAGAVFGYYLYDLRRKPQEFDKRARIFVWSVIVIVIVIVVSGFFIAGSPFKQRLVRFDQQKVNDLQMVQGQIVNYWQQKNKLPNTLTDLNDSISGFQAPLDPQTREAYTYQKSGNLSFTLCANFNLDSKNTKNINTPALRYPEGPYGMKIDNWDHSAGSICFERTIDPELYKPVLPSNK